MTNLTHLSLAQALHLLKLGELSAVDLVDAHIAAVEKNRGLNAFITETLDLARTQAIESQARYTNGTNRPLEGIPVAIKDIFCTQGVRTTNASRILENFVPPYESTVTSKLFGTGAIMLGKTNLDEFAMGSATNYSAFGPAINPWKSQDSDKDLAPGGSSGGSAVAVAARMAMAALGTDTGGSVRMPAAFCGIVGFKPTYGRCSRYGIIALASSLDQAGVFANTVEDTALIADAIMGYDEKDSTSIDKPLPDLTAHMNKSVKGLRIGIPKEYVEGLPDETQALIYEARDILQREGTEVFEVSLPHTKYGVAAYYVILPVEASSNLARYDAVRYGLRVYEEGMSLDEMYTATRTQGFGAEVKRRIMIGTYVLSKGFYDSYFAQAQKVRRLIMMDFKHAFERVDALLTPVVTGSAFALDDEASLDPVSLYLNDAFTIPTNMAGLPGIAVPAKLNARGLPLGVQVITDRFAEETMFRVARNLERGFDFRAIPNGY